MHIPVMPVAIHMAKNFAMAIPTVRDRRVAVGRTARAPDASEMGHQVDMLVDAVTATTQPNGKSILEIGPGDNLATGLVFLSLGATSYTAMDRFAGAYDSSAAHAWYNLVRTEKNLPACSFPNDRRVSTISGGVEDVGQIGKFDVVCSMAVGEHVDSVRAFAEVTRDSLAPDGVAVHIVDFSGHAMHEPSDPLAFRRIPRPVWRAMGSNRGFPNRVPFADFLAALKAAGLAVEARNLISFEGLEEVQEATFICRLQ